MKGDARTSRRGHSPPRRPGARTEGLRLPAATFRVLLERMGPSLGLWRAAEVAALRAQAYERPLLDLGCGDGLVTSLVVSRVDVGLDPDPAALARAARRGLYDRLVGCPVEEANLPAASVGCVLSNSVLEHLPRLDEALEAVGRALRPGGRLIFTAPTEALSAQLVLPLAGYAARRNRRYDHLHLWPLDRWAAHLARSGLEIEEVRPYLRSELVRAWDALEWLEQARIGHRRAIGLAWRRIPPGGMERLAWWAAGLDLAAPEPGGGRLIVARKRCPMR